MIVTDAKLMYVCTNCKIPYTFKFTLKTANDPVKVTKHIPKTKKCSVCKRDMNIKHIVFKVIDANDEYGDNAIGLWQCPNHTTFVYYPDMMRKAEDGTLSLVTVGQLLYHRYLRIVSMKYPWQCPLCGAQLQYRTEKYSHMS